LVAEEDGEVYLTIREFVDQFLLNSESEIYQYERQGMPFRPTSPHTYPKNACHRWFRGEKV
jgi:hypothetical protein